MLTRFHPSTRLQLVDVSSGEFAVAVQGANSEVHVALRLIGVTSLDQHLDHLDHLIDVIRRPRLDIRSGHAQQAIRTGKRLGVSLGEVGSRYAFGIGGGDDLVLDVSHVLHIGDFEAAPRQIAADDVERHSSAAVPEVRA